MDRKKLGKIVMAAGALLVAAVLVSGLAGGAPAVAERGSASTVMVAKMTGPAKAGDILSRHMFAVVQVPAEEAKGVDLPDIPSLAGRVLSSDVSTGSFLSAGMLSPVGEPRSSSGVRVLTVRILGDDPSAYKPGDHMDILSVPAGRNEAKVVARDATVVTSSPGRGNVTVSLEVAVSETAAVAGATASGTIVLAKRGASDDRDIPVPVQAKPAVKNPANSVPAPRQARKTSPPKPSGFVAEVLYGRRSSNVVLPE